MAEFCIGFEDGASRLAMGGMCRVGGSLAWITWKIALPGTDLFVCLSVLTALQHVGS